MKLSIGLKGIKKFRKKYSARNVEKNVVRMFNDILTAAESNIVKKAPAKRGRLRQSINVVPFRKLRDKGSVGTDIVYAWQREKGGTIKAKNKKFLHWIQDGQDVFAKEVHQKGTNWFKRGVESTKPTIKKILGGFLKRFK